MAAMIPTGCCPVLVAREPLLFLPYRGGQPSPGGFAFRRNAVALRLVALSKPAEAPRKREPRGIMKPKPISRAMQALVGVPEISRTQALKLIWAYIKQHNLQDPENKRIIVCNEKLKNIFGGRDRVGFLEILGLLNPHFGK